MDRKCGQKVLGHFCVFGAFSISHRSNPSPHTTNNVGRVYPECFFPVSTLYRVEGGGGGGGGRRRQGELLENLEKDALL